ncbi:sensor histidine kinase [Arcticibacter sp.]|uniref:sensor histidine kinase n=1 Tax=Arcticibacter sp. TaxID=1872630 RepID=UPI003890496C
MKSGIYSSKYFIGISLLLLLIFTGIALVLKDKFTSRTERISTDFATQIFKLQSLVLRDEFNNILEGHQTAKELVAQIKTDADLEHALPGLSKLLTGGPKVSNGWYAIVRKQDTLIRWIDKTTGETKAADPRLENWILECIRSSDTTRNKGDLIQVADALHWVEASMHPIQGTVTLFFGIDIQLSELQQHLWTVNGEGRAIATIVDNRGYYISNPEETLVGTKLPDSLMKFSGQTMLADSVSSYEANYSSFLQLPVIRYYTPFRVGSMNWTMIVDTPLFLVVEDTQAIERYILIIFVTSALIILFFVGISQAKWQQEFMLRQEAEMSKQRLTLEKQALLLTTEKQKTENALLQLDKLKEKVDPHFLFNSLTSLNGLIEEQPELAKSFVVKLSRVYRYVLDPPESGLAEVSQEMRFANEYFFLLQIRFGAALAPLSIDIHKDHTNTLLPFMSIQTLIENAVKHNVVSKSAPLQIDIKSNHEGIIVTNNLQLRQDQKTSGKHGLKYLEKTFTFFKVSGFKYGIEGDKFVCFLPLVKLQNTLAP